MGEVRHEGHTTITRAPSMHAADAEGTGFVSVAARTGTRGRTPAIRTLVLLHGSQQQGGKWRADYAYSINAQSGTSKEVRGWEGKRGQHNVCDLRRTDRSLRW